MKIAILGGGNGSYAAAADLADQGHDVRFWQRDEQSIRQLQGNGRALTLKDFNGERDVVLSLVTSSIGKAIDGVELIVCPTPAFAQADIAGQLAPHLVDGQVVFLPPGSLGSYLMADIVHRQGNRCAIAFAEAGTLPYLTRKHAEFTIAITTRATRLPSGVFPINRKDHALDVIRQAYPSVEDAGDGLSGALMNAGPIIHPPLILMNAGPIEHFDHWDIHNEGTQPSVRRVTTALDHERIAVREALGYGSPHFPLANHYDNDSEEWMYGNLAHDKLVDSGDWREQLVLDEHRYMREDVQIGLALLVSIAQWAKVPAPVATGLLALGSAVCGGDFLTTGRTLSSLGLQDKTMQQMKTVCEWIPSVTNQIDQSAAATELIVAVGAGRMGRGIAISFAMAGYTIRLVDVKTRPADDFEALCDEAKREISATLAMLSDFGLISRQQVAVTAARVSYFALDDSETALHDADVIFEAVPETLSAKQDAFALICQQARADALIASTTSTILSDDLQAFVVPASRFLNVHWLNPAFLVPLVEVSPAALTDNTVTVRMEQLLERIGKVPVRCAASPGYIVPRIQALAMNEAARMVEEGVATAEAIDTATRYGFGFRFAVLGLLEFIDWGGGDILYYASRYMTEAMGSDRYAAPDIIETNMRKRRTGLKTGKGFLDYSDMNIPEYQRRRLSDFIALLRHIDKLPVVADHDDDDGHANDAGLMVRQYLDAMESRDLEKAQTYLARNFQMTFPGGVTFSSLQSLVDWSKTRYRSISKSYQHVEQSQSDGDTIVYCSGTLQGVWLDGGEFSGIRFIDRFVIRDGLIAQQEVWNDLAEVAASAS